MGTSCATGIWASTERKHVCTHTTQFPGSVLFVAQWFISHESTTALPRTSRWFRSNLGLSTAFHCDTWVDAQPSEATDKKSVQFPFGELLCLSRLEKGTRLMMFWLPWIFQRDSEADTFCFHKIRNFLVFGKSFFLKETLPLRDWHFFFHQCL